MATSTTLDLPVLFRNYIALAHNAAGPIWWPLRPAIRKSVSPRCNNWSATDNAARRSTRRGRSSPATTSGCGCAATRQTAQPGILQGFVLGTCFAAASPRAAAVAVPPPSKARLPRKTLPARLERDASPGSPPPPPKNWPPSGHFAAARASAEQSSARWLRLALRSSARWCLNRTAWRGFFPVHFFFAGPESQARATRRRIDVTMAAQGYMACGSALEGMSPRTLWFDATLGGPGKRRTAPKR